jgi:Skp family chaperone for outer membrane proteins
MRERGQQARAQQQLEKERAALEDLRQQEQAELDQLEAELVPGALKLEKLELSPRKSDIAVDEVLLVWVPWWVDQGGRARPAY